MRRSSLGIALLAAALLTPALATAGEPTLQRIEAYRDQTGFTIPMPYRMALARRSAPEQVTRT